MKAIVWSKYGPPDLLQFKEVEKPIPGKDEVLIKIFSSTVTAGDCEMRSMNFSFLLRTILRIFMGIGRPKKVNILGQELAGEIESVGKEVTQFKKGDPVFASTEMRLGAHAQYICLPASFPMVLKPENISYENSATIITGGLNGLHFLRKGNIQSGEKLLINGAGGSIGTYALQIAKSDGAEVTCVDSAEKLEMLSSIGADHVIDYTLEDFTKNGESYDVIIDVVGKSSYSRSVKSLTKNGRFILGNPRLSLIIRGLWTSLVSSKKVLFELAKYKNEDLSYIAELIETGKIKPVIDKRYPLEQTAEAHRYVEDGHKKGNVIITVQHDNPDSSRE